MSWLRVLIYPLVVTISLICGAAVTAQPPPDAEKPASVPPGPSDASRSDDEPIVVTPIDVKARTNAHNSTGLDRLIDDSSEAANADRALNDSAFVTVIRIDERTGETTSVAEVLAETLGVSIRSLGGLGSFSSISVRGASSGHTAVSVDGVPLSRVASASADLGRLSLATFDYVQLYRGSVPVEMGSAALGGALDLVTPVGLPPSGQAWTLSMGGGSFGTRHVQARWLGGDARRDTAMHVSALYRGTNGDFLFYNDKGTNLNLSDDEEVSRDNNGHDQVEMALRLRRQRGAWRWEAGSRSFWRTQGLPGPGSVQSEHASATTAGTTWDGTLSKRRLWGSPRLVGKTRSFASFEWQHFQDRLGEVRLGVQDSRQWWLSTGASAVLTIDAGDTHLISLGADARFEVAAFSDALSDGDARGRGWRLGGGLMATDEISLGDDERVVLAPAARFDWLHTVPLGDVNQPIVGQDELTPRTDMFFSPRLSGRFRLTASVALKGSAGYYVREPTVPELFGGRGVHVGNPMLVPERGVSSDVGVIIAPSSSLDVFDRLYLESSGFWRRPQDTIVYRATLGGSFNLGNTSMMGTEFGASLRVAKLATLSLNYSFIRTQQESTLPSYDGKPLPHAPEHQFYARTDIARRILGRLAVFWADVSLTSGNYLDLAGLSPIPSRKFVGVGVKLEVLPKVILGIDVKNISDEHIESVEYEPPPSPDLARVPRAISDFYGYPLPGRAAYITLEWKP